MFRAMSAYISTLLTITGLATVGLVGHSTHWTFQFGHADHSAISLLHGQKGDHAPKKPNDLRTMVRLKSDASAKESGVQTAIVLRQNVVEEVEANGLIEFSPQHFVRVSSRARGTLWRIEKQLGDAVKPGDVLAIVESPEVGNLKAELLRSMTQYALRKAIASRFESVEDAIAEKQILEARAAERSAHVDLLNAAQLLANHGAEIDLKALSGLTESEALEMIRFAGIPVEIKDKLAAQRANSSLVAIKCPLEGLVIQRNGAAGETIESGAMLFEIADPSQLVLKMDVRREGATKLALGQKVNFLVDGYSRPGRAEINWIGVEVNESTRTVEARGKIDIFPEGNLKAHCFARCKIEASERNALVVPLSALHANDQSFVLFKQKSPSEFEALRVYRGIDNKQWVEVLGDLKEGDLIATEGSHALWSALILQRMAE